MTMVIFMHKPSPAFLRVWGRRKCRFACRPDPDPREPVLVAFQHDETLSVEGERLLLLWNRLSLMDDESRNRCRLIVRQLPVERPVEIADWHRPVDDNRSVGLLFHALDVDIMLVGYLTDDLLDDVFQRDQTFDLAIFIDD